MASARSGWALAQRFAVGFAEDPAANALEQLGF
jgi:hypothetical protein